MKYMVEEIFGPEVAEQMGDFWTLDKEGEVKGAFKPCGRKLPPLLVRLWLSFCLQILLFGIMEVLRA